MDSVKLNIVSVYHLSLALKFAMIAFKNELKNELSEYDYNFATLILDKEITGLEIKLLSLELQVAHGLKEIDNIVELKLEV